MSQEQKDQILEIIKEYETIVEQKMVEFTQGIPSGMAWIKDLWLQDNLSEYDFMCAFQMYCKDFAKETELSIEIVEFTELDNRSKSYFMSDYMRFAENKLSAFKLNPFAKFIELIGSDYELRKLQKETEKVLKEIGQIVSTAKSN